MRASLAEQAASGYIIALHTSLPFVCHALSCRLSSRGGSFLCRFPRYCLPTGGYPAIQLPSVNGHSSACGGDVSHAQADSIVSHPLGSTAHAPGLTGPCRAAEGLLSAAPIMRLLGLESRPSSSCHMAHASWPSLSTDGGQTWSCAWQTSTNKPRHTLSATQGGDTPSAGFMCSRPCIAVSRYDARLAVCRCLRGGATLP